MTLLSYICHRLMGKPVTGSCWKCPWCFSSGPSFSVRPPKAGYKVRFCCHRCGEWGDEFDLVQHYYPGEGYSKRRKRVEALTRDWERSIEPEPDSRVVYLSGDGDRETVNVYSEDEPSEHEFSDEADEAIVELFAYMADPPTHEALREMLKLSERVLEICAKYQLHPLGLASRCGFEVWKDKINQQHLEECQDENCDAIICRRNAGWSEEEITAGIEKMKEEHIARIKRRNRAERRSRAKQKRK